MRFEVNLARTEAEFVRLVDDAHRNTDRGHLRQFQHIVVEHAEAAMAGAHADTKLFIRTVDQVARHTEGELVRPQGVIRARGHHRRQDVTIGGVLLAD
ncbi:hypothetical protein D3C81_1778550 [compost metagenome]